MKSKYLYMLFVCATLLGTSCMEETELPTTVDITSDYKMKLIGEWEPIEQEVFYYTTSYQPGRDTVVVFTTNDFNDLESSYYNGLYNLKIKVAEKKESIGNVISLKFNDDLSYAFNDLKLAGASFHIVEVDGNKVINFMKYENESSTVKQIERMPYTILSLTDSELIVGTKSDSQESVFTGEYNKTTGLPVSQNRWCTHTITYRKK